MPTLLTFTGNDSYQLDAAEFEKVLLAQFEKMHARAPSEMMEKDFIELNYSARIAAVVSVTRDQGFSLSFDDFNKAVNGMLRTKEVPVFINTCIRSLVEQRKKTNDKQ